MSKLAGMVAVVTGAGRGIGEAIARSLDEEGASVVVSDVTGEQDHIAAQLRNGGLGLHADVSRDSDVKALIERTVAEFGRIDVLCNNAGIDGEMKPLIETSLEDFEQVIAVNLRGVFLGLRHAIPAMIDTGGGSIINIASIAGLVAFPGSTSYTASKAGVIGLTRVAAAEYGAANVRVNSICPGVIETPMLRELEHLAPDVHQQIVSHGESMSAVKRLGRTDEIAALAVLLASRDSSFLTGAAIPVDGGYSAM
jgi:NAD(P)-dependent dehydrogenase (short-subunit alcohol dehydrogenase family)